MKYVLVIATAALFAAASVPVIAEECVITNNHVSDPAVPPVCLLPETKTEHPNWFRDGGYCEGATTTTNVTAFTNGEDCRDES